MKEVNPMVLVVIIKPRIDNSINMLCDVTEFIESAF